MKLISSDLKIDFLGKKYFAFFLSAILVAASAYIWIERGESKYGIDYLGGHKIIVSFEEQTTSEAIRKALSGDDMDVVVQSFEMGSNEFSIRVSSELDSKEVLSSITSKLSDGGLGEYKIIQQDFVGPTIGNELKRNALIAIVVGLFGMLLYITYRFEMAFAVGAVAALFHDVIVTMGVYLFCGNTISVATLAAALTIVGYSVNDTIIVFDRIREEIFRQKKFDLLELMNFSINRTLSRTVITSLLTLFSAIALLVYGGGAIADLSLFLCVGVITGTYSTIFIASPVALAFENMRRAPEPSSGSGEKVTG